MIHYPTDIVALAYQFAMFKCIYKPTTILVSHPGDGCKAPFLADFPL